MAYEVVVPQMGESVLEGTIVEWKVSEGDKVRVNHPLVEIMTDKVNVEIPAEVDGVIEKIMVEPGEVVKVGKVICKIAAEGEIPPKEGKPPEKDKPAEPAPKAEKKPAAPSRPAGKKPSMAPAVRKMIRDFGLDPAAITGTGPDGRITESDVQQAAADRSTAAGIITATPSAPSAGIGPAEAKVAAEAPVTAPPSMPKYIPPSDVTGEKIEERIPLEGVRKSIAEHMTRSKQIAAHVTTFEDCDFTSLVDFRNSTKDRFLATYGVKLTFMPFIMKSAVEALKEFPTLNASMTDTEIIIKKYYNIGIAVARENGLIVPVVHNADRKSIIDLAIEIADLGSRARSDQLKLDEVQGGTFTLTNAGMFGATASTPIINQPQAAILGIHNISEKPAVRKGEIVIRHMSTFGLSFDHRLIDGHTAVLFLHRLVEYLQDPQQLLLRFH